MPSKVALLIVQKCEEYLERELTHDEQIKCEELNINYHTNAILAYIDGLIRKEAPRDFGLVYHAIMNGLLRGAYRRHDLIHIEGRFKEVYDRLHSFVGDGMSNAELEAVIFMAEDCTNKEMEAAIAVARMRGVHHIKYVRAVIEGNRRAVSKHALSKQNKFVPTEHEKAKRIDVPRVDVVRTAWRHRLEEARAKVLLVKAELNARKKSGHKGTD
ncbi:MAG: hypothetical protein WC822_02385 [Candidatus Paceibacterota bacterium]|jgi:hypothetical protein